MLMQKLVFVAQTGASVVLYILIMLSVLSVGVVIERWWYFRKRRFNFAKASTDLEKSLRSGDVAGARKELSKHRAIEAECVNDALAWYDEGAEAITEILQKGVRQRRKLFEGGLLFLGTLGNNAPFVGLFGTVLGVVAAFKELGAAQSAMAAGGGGMNNVMGGIAEALVATAIGILVAIPAVVAYNIFQKRGSDIEENTAALGNVIVASMKVRPAKAVKEERRSTRNHRKEDKDKDKDRDRDKERALEELESPAAHQVEASA
jgi:biopolymer transport protein ExbB/biopolymer transport protein TolQ